MLIEQLQDWYLLPRGEEWWVLGVGMMTNVSCALIGCYLVMRRMSLMGDAISHAVLPGLVVAFIFTGSLNIGGMILGAFAVGLLTTFLTQTLHRHGGVPADASMGVVFTSLFALGVVLLRRYAHNVDLDADCVLQGVLSFVANPKIEIWGLAIPRAAMSSGSVLLLNMLFIAVLWKELKISSFDPELATTMGINATLLHYLLMAMVAATTVASFEAVGSILVIAMLIVPGATAHLLTDRLKPMLIIAGAVGAISAYLGYLGTFWITEDAEPAGLMVCVSAVLFMLAVFFSPRYGIVSTLWRNLQTTSRIIREDVLAMLYRLEELAVERLMGTGEAAQAVGGGLASRLAIWGLLRRGSIERTHGGLRLTEAGRRQAASLVRSHRLWEAYLVEFLGMPLDRVHAPAARMEHYIGQELQQQIAADLREGETDPHGREIPR
ncbi:MAG: iron chelate uptake ABC transporter family permease subunit [Planctomycetota bacterium]|nr:iron chelate uptake ABC transporter family permease subunit [Planctomycetota bacterium]